jgi:hypothetical protein
LIENPFQESKLFALRIDWNTALRIAVEILFEERKKIETESLTRRGTPYTLK